MHSCNYDSRRSKYIILEIFTQHYVYEKLLLQQNFTNISPTLQTSQTFYVKSQPIGEPGKNSIQKPQRLPPNIFTLALSSWLSPDITISQDDPIAFLLDRMRITAIYPDKMHTINCNLKSLLKDKKFPKPYIPYAQLLYRLIPIVPDIKKVNNIINLIKLDSLLNKSRKMDHSSFDPDLQELYSHNTIFDPRPPSRLLNKLLEIPNNEISNVIDKLKRLLKDPNFSSSYSGYTDWIRNFLHDNHLLAPLKRNIARIECIRAENLETMTSNQGADSISDR